VNDGAWRKLRAGAVALVGEDGFHPGLGSGGLYEIGRVRDDEDVILGDGQVQFENVCSVFDGVLEGRDGVFGASSAASAVSVDEDGLCTGRKGRKNKEKGEQSKEHEDRFAFYSYKSIKPEEEPLFDESSLIVFATFTSTICATFCQLHTSLRLRALLKPRHTHITADSE
jgi:hypothetical protein